MSEIIRIVRKNAGLLDVRLVRCAGCGDEYETTAFPGVIKKLTACMKCNPTSARLARAREVASESRLIAAWAALTALNEHERGQVLRDFFGVGPGRAALQDFQRGAS